MGLEVRMQIRNNKVETAVFPTGNTNRIPGVPAGMGKSVASTGEVRSIAREMGISDSDINGDLILAVRAGIGNQEYWLEKEYKGMSGVQRMAQEGRSTLTRMDQTIQETVKDIDDKKSLGRDLVQNLGNALSELRKNFTTLSDWERMYTNSTEEVREDSSLTRLRQSVSAANSILRQVSNNSKKDQEYSRAITGLSSAMSSLSSVRTSKDRKDISSKIMDAYNKLSRDTERVNSIYLSQDSKRLNEIVKAMQIMGRTLGFKFSRVRLSF